MLKKYEDIINSYNINLFKEGKHFRSYEFMRAHKVQKGKEKGVTFTVWAPNANQVYLSGAFNDWNKTSHPMKNLDKSGIWNIFIPKMEL